MKKLIAFVLSLVMTAALAVPSLAAGPGAVSTTRAAATSTSKSQESGDTAGTRQGRPAASQNLSEIISSYNNPNGRILCAAKSGMPRNYPEDSLQGLQACIDAGVDIVAVNVQKTKDNQLVVMEDSTLKRMCVNRIDRKTATGKVSQYTLAQMTGEFYLRSGRGGANRGVSSQRVPSLAQAIHASKQGCMLYISNGWKYADLVNNTARAEDACGSVIIGGADSAEKAKAFIGSAGTPICHIAGYYNDGETEGSAKTFVSDSLNTGVNTVLLRSKNQYSSIFKKSTMKKFHDSGRAMINATQRAFCGDYKDDIEGWESLIDSGYSIIETDYPKELATYISDVESCRANLRSLMTQANALNLSKYDNSNVKQLDKALKEADAVVNLGAVSRSQIDNARYDLQEALDALDTGEVVPKRRMNPVGVIVIILVVLVLLTLLVIRWKRRGARPAGGARSAEPKRASRKVASTAGAAAGSRGASDRAAPAKSRARRKEQTQSGHTEQAEVPAAKAAKPPAAAARQGVVDYSGSESPEKRRKKKPVNDIPDPNAAPEDPTLKEIATKAGHEFKEEAGELMGAAGEKIAHSEFAKKARRRLGKEEPADEPAKSDDAAKPKDNGPSLFDQYDK